MLQLADNIQKLHQNRQVYVLVTLMNIKGSAPQINGAKMLVTTDGLFWGTVGGGKIEAHCIKYAQDLLSKKASSHAETWNLQKEIGMSCGGEVTLFFDVNHGLDWQVAIFGAGHVAQELCRVMSSWSCQLSVFDTRPEWLEKLPTASNINKKLCTDLASEVATLAKSTFLLSLTQGHAADVPVIKAACDRGMDFPFIGVIGSDIKGKKIKAELLELGADKLQVERLVCPVGLALGDNTPSEISISIGAQLIAVRDGISFSIRGGLHD